MKDAHYENLNRIYDEITALSDAAAEMVDVATEIEDYEAVHVIAREIETVRKKLTQYVSIWEKNMRGQDDECGNGKN